MSDHAPHTRLDRRRFLEYFAAAGLGSTLFPGALWGRLAGGAEITAETVACAEEIAGLRFTPEQRDLMVEDLREHESHYVRIRSIPLPNDVPPAFRFDPLLPGATLPSEPQGVNAFAGASRALPTLPDELAFYPVLDLAELLRTRQLSSEELTRLYLDRIARYDGILHAVVTVTEDRALRQARAADAEIAAGRYRGPLHGIPWGAKDLLAVRGYPTTWGSVPFRDQVIDEDATVVQRLDAAGAVLIAKLALGELAWGDVWFGGTTRTPWDPAQGASGSSAGPGAATAAGLVAFSIGSETLGSISSPSTRNGVTGLRPTFGRVPRTGAMALSWTMDKLGPMCRTVADCAAVFDAIRGPDGRDLTTRAATFNWDPAPPLDRLRIGYVPSPFVGPPGDRARPFDLAALEVLRSLGATPVPVQLPEADYDAMSLILTVEAAAAFDELTRSGRDRRMVRQVRAAWPNVFRAARFVPAVEYVNANRVRTLAMEAWAELFSRFDILVVPTTGTQQVTATNLTGHPAVILPHGFGPDGMPLSLTFLGGLYREGTLLSVAHAFQSATDFHLRRPDLDRHLRR